MLVEHELGSVATAKQVVERIRITFVGSPKPLYKDLYLSRNGNRRKHSNWVTIELEVICTPYDTYPLTCLDRKPALASGVNVTLGWVMD